MHAKGFFLGGLALTLLGGEGVASELYLYTPASASREQVSTKANDAIAVQEITVTRGDSLFKISRRNCGRGSYYPQILIFNAINNPDLIYPGQKLRIPLIPGRKAARSEKAVAPAPQTKTEPSSQPLEPASPAATRTVAPPVDKKTSPTTSVTRKASATAEQKLYAKGIKAYKAGKCRQAIKSFDRFLADYPGSLFAADASLYRADCYLKLAGE